MKVEPQFSAHSIDQNLVTWLHVASREAEKHGLAMGTGKK